MTSTEEYQLTKDGAVAVGTEKEVAIPGSLTEDASQTLGHAADLWGTTLSQAEVEASTFGVWTQRGGTSDDLKGRTIGYVWLKVHYTVPVVGDPPVTYLAQTRYLPGVSTRNGPMSLRRG